MKQNVLCAFLITILLFDVRCALGNPPRSYGGSNIHGFPTSSSTASSAGPSSPTNPQRPPPSAPAAERDQQDQQNRERPPQNNWLSKVAFCGIMGVGILLTLNKSGSLPSASGFLPSMPAVPSAQVFTGAPAAVAGSSAPARWWQPNGAPFAIDLSQAPQQGLSSSQQLYIALGRMTYGLLTSVAGWAGIGCGLWWIVRGNKDFKKDCRMVLKTVLGESKTIKKTKARIVATNAHNDYLASCVQLDKQAIGREHAQFGIRRSAQLEEIRNLDSLIAVGESQIVQFGTQLETIKKLQQDVALMKQKFASDRSR